MKKKVISTKGTGGDARKSFQDAIESAWDNTE
jgi:hypothetical protein